MTRRQGCSPLRGYGKDAYAAQAGNERSCVPTTVYTRPGAAPGIRAPMGSEKLIQSKLHMEEAINDVCQLVKEDYTFDEALCVWKRHAQSWPENYELPAEDIRYRASCIRSHSKEYSYSHKT